MCAGSSKVHDFGVRSVGASEPVGGGAINEPAEWQRF
jgi:hypothetical protein